MRRIYIIIDLKLRSHVFRSHDNFIVVVSLVSLSARPILVKLSAIGVFILFYFFLFASHTRASRLYTVSKAVLFRSNGRTLNYSSQRS
ncbi:hypothetical protein PUN28_000888 [Cardiocondyla obscurior]|uniref:Uncharacterized protein n=1 Tax=Cardiocondyla obscurior TaxID=286306 RepID=A0AAW2H1N3_9HYME